MFFDIGARVGRNGDKIMDILTAIENYNNNKGKLADIWDSAKELQDKLRKRNTQIADLRQRLMETQQKLIKAQERLDQWEYKGQDIEN